MKHTDSPRLVTAGAVFIDDIVLPDGTTHMGTLGGGAVHAAMGALLWGESPGISAYIGNDLPEEPRDFMAQRLDVSGIVQLDIPQARAWQIFEHDGTRRELHRVVEIAPFIMGTTPRDLPEPFRAAEAYYLLQDFDGMRQWMAVSGYKLWEPNQLSMLSGEREIVHEVLSQGAPDIISTNVAEAQSVYGSMSPEALVENLQADGAGLVVLRMGADGSLISDRSNDEQFRIPALDVPQVVDQTGAGNTYNGALLAGLLNDHTLHEAVAMAAVAASFCIESPGVVVPESIPDGERDRRYEQALKMIT